MSWRLIFFQNVTWVTLELPIGCLWFHPNTGGRISVNLGKSQTTNAWSRSVEADWNIAHSFRQTRSKVSLKLLSFWFLEPWTIHYIWIIMMFPVALPPVLRPRTVLLLRSAVVAVSVCFVFSRDICRWSRQRGRTFPGGVGRPLRPVITVDILNDKIPFE